MVENNSQPKAATPVSWEANEFETNTRGASWYLSVGAVLGLLLIYTIYIQQWMLSAVVVMVGVVLFLSGRLRPRRVRYSIGSGGFSMGEQVLTYDQLKTFWFSRPQGASVTLNLISTMRLMPVISVKVPSEMAVKVRAVLAEKMPESDNKKEDWIDRINRFLKV